MKKKILGAALAIIALTSVGVIYSASKRQNSKNESASRGTYKERLERAKERGDKKLRSHAVIPLYAQVDFDQALTIYDLVIGEFVFSKSFSTDNDGNIVTWYKFKVLETLSKATTHRLLESDPPPPELLPLAHDEILVWKTGGTVEIDGIEIEMEEVGFPPFDKSNKYLLVLAVDRDKQTGSIEVGPSGALVVKPDDTLQAFAKNGTYFKSQIENRYGPSVTKLTTRAIPLRTHRIPTLRRTSFSLEVTRRRISALSLSAAHLVHLPALTSNITRTRYESDRT